MCIVVDKIIKEINKIREQFVLPAIDDRQIIRI